MSRSRKNPTKPDRNEATKHQDTNAVAPESERNEPEARLDGDMSERRDFFATETGENSVFTEATCDDFPQFFTRMAKEKAERMAKETGADFSGEDPSGDGTDDLQTNGNLTPDDQASGFETETAYENATRKFPYSRASWERDANEDNPWPQDLSQIDTDKNGYLNLEGDNSRSQQNTAKTATGPSTSQGPDGGEANGEGWSNSARTALGDMLKDIHEEQAERASRRDIIAARAGKRRTTGPVTALIVALLVVVVAYSLRNFDGANSPEIIRSAASMLNQGDETNNAPATSTMVVASQQSAQSDLTPGASKVEEGVGGTLVPLAEAEAVSRPQANEVAIEVAPISATEPTNLFVEPVRLVQPKLTAAAKPYDPAPKLNADEGPSLALMPSIPVSRQTATAEQAKGEVTAQAPDKMPPASIAALASDTPRSTSSGLAVSGIVRNPRGEEIALSGDRSAKKVASTAPDIMFSAISRSETPVAAVPRAIQKGNGGIAPSTEQAAVMSTGTNRLLERAEEMLEMRDLVSARLLFERAASQGSADGQFGAGKTYDPLCFEKLGVHGVPAEPEKAMSHYRSAAKAGHGEAKKFLGLLQSWMDTKAPLRSANR